MSAAANWSYTARATLWPWLGRDDWSGVETFGPPQAIDCDYSAESKRMTDAKGVEFVTRQILYTERADIKQGDRVLIGESAVVSPIDAGALEVRAVKRDADTFDRVADDYQVMT
jgi:glutaredoxin